MQVALKNGFHDFIVNWRGRILKNFEDLGKLPGYNSIEISKILPQFQVDASILFAKFQDSVCNSEVNFMASIVILLRIIW